MFKTRTEKIQFSILILQAPWALIRDNMVTDRVGKGRNKRALESVFALRENLCSSLLKKITGFVLNVNALIYSALIYSAIEFDSRDAIAMSAD